MTPVQVFWQWDFKGKCSRNAANLDWLVTCGRIAGIHFFGEQDGLYFPNWTSRIEELGMINGMSHDYRTLLNCNIATQHWHEWHCWSQLEDVQIHSCDMYIYNMCIIYTYLFILFPQMYRLLSNFICIGIRLPHQTPIYAHHATCSVTFPETNQTHLQMGRNPKLIWTNHPFSDAKMLGFRESTFLFSELTD